VIARDADILVHVERDNMLGSAGASIFSLYDLQLSTDTQQLICRERDRP
jgi:hypothetical protein